MEERVPTHGRRAGRSREGGRLKVNIEIKTLTSEIEKKTAWIEALERNYTALVNLCASQATKIHGLTSQLSGLQQVEQEHDDRDARIAAASKTIRVQVKESEALRRELEQAAEEKQTLERQLKQKVDEVRRMDQQEDRLMKRLRSAKQARERAESQLEQVSQKLHERAMDTTSLKLQAQVSSLQKEIASLQRGREQDQARVETERAEKTRALNKLRKLELTSEGEAVNMERYRKQVSELRQAVEAVRGARQSDEDLRQRLATESKNLTIQLELKDKRLGRMQETLKIFESSKSVLLSQFEAAKSRAAELEKRLTEVADLREKLANTRKLLEVSRKEKFRLFEEEGGLRKTVKSLSARVGELTTLNSALLSENKRLQSDKAFLQLEKQKVLKSQADIDARLRSLDDAMTADKPAGWSDRIAELVKEVAAQHTAQRALEKKLHETEQEVQSVRARNIKLLRAQKDASRSTARDADAERKRATMVMQIETMLDAENASAKAFTCTISGKVFRNPVTNPRCGHSFSKASVEGRDTCPICGAPATELVENQLLDELCTAHRRRLAGFSDMLRLARALAQP